MMGISRRIWFAGFIMCGLGVMVYTRSSLTNWLEERRADAATLVQIGTESLSSAGDTISAAGESLSAAGDTLLAAAEPFPGCSKSILGCKRWDVVIVGAGLSGAVLSDLYARHMGLSVLVIENRNHIAGNCYDYIDEKTGILMSKFGVHLFHTKKEHVWRFVLQFGEWTPHEHRVIGRVDGKLVPIPANVETVRLLVDDSIDTPEKMKTWIEGIRSAANSSAESVESQNSEEVAIGRVGENLYNKLFKDYTKKQWAIDPTELEGSVLARIPVTLNWDDRYFPNDPYQGLPAKGYTSWFEYMFTHPNIEVRLNLDYHDVEQELKLRHLPDRPIPRTYFTGPIDQFFQRRGSQLPPLPYRSLRFEETVVDTLGVKQPMAQYNFPQLQSGNHTRVVEYKHLYRQNSEKTILVKEFSSDEGEPYYPVPTPQNRELFEEYRKLAQEMEQQEKVHFVGRLANYKYFNMDDAIDNVLKMFTKIEGPAMIHKMLASAPTPESFGRKGPRAMQVDFIVSVRGPTERWRELCNDPSGFFKQDTVRTRMFVFVLEPTRSLQDVVSELKAGWQGCPLSENDIDVRYAEMPDGGPTRVALSYMFTGQFWFGDANVFLSESGDAAAGPSAKKIICLLEKVRESLWSRNATRASHAANLFTDVSLVDPEASAEGECIAGALEPSLHFMPLSQPKKTLEGDGVDIAKRYWSLMRKKVEWDATERIESVSSDFIVTDAGIRRMLQRHRTWLWDDALPDLAGLAGGDVKNVQAAVNSLWHSIFLTEKMVEAAV